MKSGRTSQLPRACSWLLIGVLGFCFAGTTSAQEQPVDVSILLEEAERFFEGGNDFAGVTESWRFLHAAPEHPLAFFANYQIGLAESRMNNPTQATRMLQLAVRRAPNESMERIIRYRLAVHLLMNEEIDSARLELYRLSLVRPDSLLAAQANLLLALAATSRHDLPTGAAALAEAREWQIGNPAFQDVAAELEQVLDDGVNGRMKSPRFAQWASTFVPGSGQMYSGEWLDGFFALSLNTGTSYLVVRAWQQGTARNAVLLILNLWWRYYKGNRLHAREAAIMANHAHFERVVEDVAGLLLEAGGHLSTTSATVTLAGARASVR